MLVSRSSPFGGQARILVLLAPGLLDESFPRELARLLEVPLNGVQQALRGLEVDGLVAARSAGRTRLYRLNPLYFARQELQAYLKRLAGAETGLVERTARVPPTRSRSFLKSFDKPQERGQAPGSRQRPPESARDAPDATRPPRSSLPCLQRPGMLSGEGAYRSANTGA